MEQFAMIVVLAWLGTILGSFVGAQVWRLRAHQLIEDKRDGEQYDEKQLKQINGLARSAKTDRSECLSCHHRLAWYDLIPIVSWATLRGRCRYCRKPIGYMEPLLELGLALTFVISYLAWPAPLNHTIHLVAFVVWLVGCTLMALLFAYDARWYLLPFSINVALIGVGAVFAATTYLSTGAFSLEQLWSLLLAIVIMSGLYFIFSLRGYVGLGDSILGFGLALFLGKWEYAFLALFIANLLGCFLLIPIALKGKMRRNLHIPFGPFLILGTIITLLWGATIISVAFTWSDALLTMLMV
ncbi:prepilin peptidase [Microbacteriaceae bacterium]|nr:prepilin peptidase [Candidatus Saccharibacteria bacterium]